MVNANIEQSERYVLIPVQPVPSSVKLSRMLRLWMDGWMDGILIATVDTSATSTDEVNCSPIG